MSDAGLVCTRIRFTPEPVTEPVDPGSTPAVVPFGEIYALRASASGAAIRWLEAGQGHPVVVAKAGGAYWSPGRVAVEGVESSNQALLDALIEFAFLENELRSLEEGLPRYEDSAPADAAIAFEIRPASRPQWERWRQTIANLSLQRLKFVRLAPRLTTAPLAFEPEIRRVFTHLAGRTEVEARLEAFSDRLEPLEDLYEGAVDRVADFRGYRRGEILEIIIIVLLVLETIAMIAALLTRP